jgi:integrase
MSDTGKRQARFFKTKEEALGEVQRLKVRKENHGTAAKLLAPADEQQAAAAIKLLRDKGLTIQLSEVVGDYIRRFEERNASVTLDHAFAEYLKHLKRNHRSEVHRQSIENVQERFAFAKDRIVADLKPSDIEKGLEGAAPSYRNAVLVRIRGVLNYGMKGGRKWLSSNPANDCEIITRKLGEVGIYSVEEIGAVMATTARLHPDLVPALALMTFAGIRPDHEDGEIVKLQWDHLILKDREKRVELP